jgi:serine phosphatase RsbU (regulator of sigma subunit)
MSALPAPYPWQSDVVFAALLDRDGIIRRANPALLAAREEPVEGTPFAALLIDDQRGLFERQLDTAGDSWMRDRAGFLGGPLGGVDERCLWLRRRPDGQFEVIAEPAWSEHRRLVEQVLQLNADLISSQRTVARRQRDLEHAQTAAASSAQRVRQLEAILLAGLTPVDFEDALQSLLAIARSILPGDHAAIFLRDESAGRVVLRARAGNGDGHGAGSPAPETPVGVGVLGGIVAHGETRLIDDLQAEPAPDLPDGPGSFIGAPLKLEGQVIGVMTISAGRPNCFSVSDLRLLEAVGERVALAIGQAQLREREQRMAETLQRTLLPQSLPRVAGVELTARYLPHTAGVGGDFYDALALPGGAVGVAIGDVTGKGLRAAAAMGRLRSALHAYALDSPAPSDVLRRLGRLAAADGAMATALYLHLDPASGRVDLASAGHLPPLLVSRTGADYVDVVPALSPPLGVPGDRDREVSFELAVGETLVLYTDGLVERSRNIDQGMRRLRDAVADLRGSGIEELSEQLVASLTAHGRFGDDIAVLVVRRGGLTPVV